MKIYEQGGKAYYDALKRLKTCSATPARCSRLILMVGEITGHLCEPPSVCSPDPHFAGGTGAAIVGVKTEALEESAQQPPQDGSVNENGL